MLVGPTGVGKYPGNSSVISTAMNALLLYPDRPFGLGTIYGFCRNEETGERERFVILQTRRSPTRHSRTPKNGVSSKSAKRSWQRGEKCRSLRSTRRSGMCCEGFRISSAKRESGAKFCAPKCRRSNAEAWYRAEQLKNRPPVCICHPKLVQTGLDLLDFPTILFYETGYSTYVLRQASRPELADRPEATGSRSVS